MPWRGWESPWKVIRDFESLLLPSVYKTSEATKLVLHPTLHTTAPDHGRTGGTSVRGGSLGTTAAEERGCRAVGESPNPGYGHEQGSEVQCWKDVTS